MLNGKKKDVRQHVAVDPIKFFELTEDGNGAKYYHDSQVIVLGIGRTGKTTVCRELAKRGILAANCPIDIGLTLPHELDEVDPYRVFVLDVATEVVCKRRAPRSSWLPGYASERRVLAEECEEMEQLDHRRQWTHIDATGLSPQQLAEEIIRLLRKRFPQG